MLRILGILVAIAAIATFAIFKFVTGDVVTWSYAYEVLEAGEIAHARAGRGDERVLLANAMVESEPPRGMPTDRRLHPPSTLAHLRFERLESDGAVHSTTEVRALVPSLPAFGAEAPGAPFGLTACPRRCAEQLAKSGAFRIDRGGSPGLSPEWVLRMPVGPTFELGNQSYTLQDLEDPRPISLPQARYRVTLLEACPARVRVGEVTSLEFHESAVIPVPKEFRTRHWVQVDDCPVLVKKRPSRPQLVPAETRVAKTTPEYGYSSPKLELIVPRRDSPLGRASLVVDEGAMLVRKDAMHVSFRRICRYDAKSNRWEPLPPPGALEVSGPPRMNVTRVAYRFPEDPGFYWAEWSEVAASEREAARTFAVMVTGGSPKEPDAIPDPVSGCAATATIAR